MPTLSGVMNWRTSARVRSTENRDELAICLTGMADVDPEEEK